MQIVVKPNAQGKLICRPKPLNINWIDKNKRSFVSFEVKSPSIEENKGVLIVRKGSDVDSQKKYPFYYSDDKRRITLNIEDSIDDNIDLILYFGKKNYFNVKLENLFVSNGRNIKYFTNGEWSQEETISKHIEWVQEGSKLVCKSFFGRHFAEFPCEWDIKQIPEIVFKVSEYYLMSPLFAFFFTEEVVIKKVMEELQEYRINNQQNVNEKSKPLISFSFGVDSTAAAALLSETAIKFYLDRTYNKYTASNGKVVNKNNFIYFEKIYHKVPNLFIVKTNFEIIAPAAGMPHGFRHNWGYSSIGVILAHVLGCDTLCFGSVLQEMFLGSKSNYIDVIERKTSGYNTNKEMINLAGLKFALPTGGISEILTTKIANEGKLQGVASFCPNIDDNGTPCYKCWKCFRKIRLSGYAGIKPNETVYDVLSKRPIKQAPTVIYAVKKSNELEYLPSTYHDIDVDFLESYYDYALENMMPNDLYVEVVSELERLNVKPMIEKDILRMQDIGEKLL